MFGRQIDAIVLAVQESADFLRIPTLKEPQALQKRRRGLGHCLSPVRASPRGRTWRDGLPHPARILAFFG